MAESKPIKQQDFSGGMMESNVSLAPSNTISLLLNMDADIEIGSAVSRLGTATVGAQIVAGNPILGLQQHVDLVTPANNKLFATINASGGATSIIRNVTDASDSQTGLTASALMRFLTFNGATLAINGADAERSYTSAGWITTGGAFDLANIPSSNTVNLCEAFLGRVYVAGDDSQPTRLYYSGLTDGATVSWTSGNGYIDIEPRSSSGIITALAKVPGYLLIFKERAMHRWNFSSAFPENLIQIGTPNQESVVMSGGLCAFFSRSNESAPGFYVTNGGRPICISGDNNRPIKKWITAISASTVVAGWASDRAFCWSVGDLTVDGEVFTNVVLRYNRLLNQWSVRTYPQEFRVFTTYDPGSLSAANTIVGGGTDGTVYRMDRPGIFKDANTTTTQNFPIKVRQQHLTYGDNREKTINDKIVIRGKNLNSCRVSVIVDEEVLNPIEVSGNSFIKKVLSWFGVGNQIKGSTIAIQVSGESAGSPVYIREIEIPSISIDNNYV
jgi:hypothetical protein